VDSVLKIRNGLTKNVKTPDTLISEAPLWVASTDAVAANV
jgi:hypothetical protein